jgi:hypothetical protein
VADQCSRKAHNERAVNKSQNCFTEHQAYGTPKLGFPVFRLLTPALNGAIRPCGLPRDGSIAAAVNRVHDDATLRTVYGESCPPHAKAHNNVPRVTARYDEPHAIAAHHRT